MTKRRRNKNLLGILVLILGIFTFTISGCDISEKIPIPTVEDGVYVYDDGNIIDDDVETTINNMLVELEEKTEVEFAVITVEDLRGLEIEEYANNLFNTLGIGKKGEDNGLLLLISQPDERVRLEIGRGLEGSLNDAKCGRILDDYFVPYRENDEYTKGTELTVEATLNVLADEYDVQIQGLDEDLQVEEEEEETSGGFFIAIVIILVIIIVIIIIASSDDNYYGGGFFGGGFSSGGGFSGGSFGGGFSGGGGASR